MEEARNPPKVKSTGVGTHAHMAHNIKQLDNEIIAGHSDPPSHTSIREQKQEFKSLWSMQPYT